jgi:Ca2+-binding EF-hand superfamily protein
MQERDNLVQVIDCYLTLHKVNQDERQKMAKMFNEMDRDCSGHIEKTEFIELFKLHSKLTTEEEL